MNEYDSYSPQLRTALVLSGIGTAGAYHAGVLRALDEAGVKFDIVAGRGIGVVGALFSAIDGAQHLWEERGFWRSPAIRELYGWRFASQLAVRALAVAFAVVAIPLVAVAAGLVVFPIDFLLKMVGSGSRADLTAGYVRLVERMFAPDGLPTWLPRAVFLVLLVAAAVAAVDGWKRTLRQGRGGFWWRFLGAPLDAQEAASQCWAGIWTLMRGATRLRQPSSVDLARRYAEMLADNLGQPRFRELLMIAHDIDAHRDVVFALVTDARRRDLVRRPTVEAAEERRAEVVDLAGVGRDHLADAVAGALAVPVATDAHPMQFEPDSYWRGETHRLVDRPSSLVRLLQELAALGAQQVVVVSAAPEAPGPHALARPRLDGRGRVGEFLHSAEAAAMRDATRVITAQIERVFTIRPAHNPVGPFDFTGGYDDRSDRHQPLAELVTRGYEDAYRQFIEPIVGASGDRVGTPA